MEEYLNLQTKLTNLKNQVIEEIINKIKPYKWQKTFSLFVFQNAIGIILLMHVEFCLNLKGNNNNKYN